MHIDWFVFFSQIVNLMILVFLLKKFLYGKIIGAMDAREAKIAGLFSEAEQARQESQAAAETSQRKLRELDEGYEAMLDKSRQDAEKFRERLEEKAREETDFLKRRWIDAVKSERENFLRELRHLAGKQTYAITRRVLYDLAEMDLEERIVEILAERIASMDEGERVKFREPLENGGVVTVTSAFDLSPERRGKLEAALRRYIAPDIEVVYESSDDLLSGCELRSDGHKIAWSIKDYIDTLEMSFYTALYEDTKDWK
jgi:F-type H+-transporting ATPase subunit b